MEFYNISKGTVESDDKRNWYLHSFGIIDYRDSDFLEVLEEYLNDAVRYRIEKVIEDCSRFRYSQSYGYVLKKKDMPFTTVEVNGGNVLVCRKLKYYLDRNGDSIFTDNWLQNELVSTMQEVLNRNGKVDNNERKCMAWIWEKIKARA